MKKLVILLVVAMAAALTMPANAEEVGALPGLAAQPPSYFYTGKPYDADLGGYIFAYRSYDPVINRWTSPDPSGFPDGANNSLYAPVPTLGLDPDGLVFLKYHGGSITVFDGAGWQSDGTVDWGNSGQSWSAVSGGTAGAGGIPTGWYRVGEKRPTAGFQDSLNAGLRSESDFTYNGIRFQGTMSAWEKTGYGSYEGPPEYGAGNTFYGYDKNNSSDAALGTPNAVQYKFLLSGIHGNQVVTGDGFRIHPKDATTTSGCIGLQGYAEAVSFESWMSNHSGIEMIVE